MKISIIGTGEVGTYYAGHWSKAGHELVLTYYRDPIKIEALALRLGKNISVAPPQKAVAQADAVLFCPRHVKAFHNLGIQTIIENSQRELVAFSASDDTDAAKLVMELATQAHLTPMLSGALATAALSEFPGPLFGVSFTAQEARKSLEMAINNI